MSTARNGHEPGGRFSYGALWFPYVSFPNHATFTCWTACQKSTRTTSEPGVSRSVQLSGAASATTASFRSGLIFSQWNTSAFNCDFRLVLPCSGRRPKYRLYSMFPLATTMTPHEASRQPASVAFPPVVSAFMRIMTPCREAHPRLLAGRSGTRPRRSPPCRSRRPPLPVRPWPKRRIRFRH